MAPSPSSHSFSPPSPSSSSFSPALFSIQLFLERLSSPWEPNFDSVRSLQIRFLPASSNPDEEDPAAVGGEEELPLGKGRLFIVRRDRLGWLQLVARKGEEEEGSGSGGERGCWRGILKLAEERAGPLTSPSTQTVCRLSPLPGHPPLELSAHLLVSIDELRKRRGAADEKKRKEVRKMRDGWVQTDEKEKERRPRKRDTGAQTEDINEEGTKGVRKGRIAGQVGGRGAAERVVGMVTLLMMALAEGRRRRAKTDGVGFAPMACLHSRATMTRVSLPPTATTATNFRQHYSPSTKTTPTQLRAQIAHLSAVHRTLVPRGITEETKRRVPVWKDRSGKEEGALKAKGREREAREGRTWSEERATARGQTPEAMRETIMHLVEPTLEANAEEGSILQSVAASSGDEAVEDRSERRNDDDEETPRGTIAAPPLPLSPDGNEAAASSPSASSSSSSSRHSLLPSGDRQRHSTPQAIPSNVSSTNSSSLSPANKSNSSSSSSSTSVTASSVEDKHSSKASNSSSLKGSSAKTDSSIAMEIAGSAAGNSSDGQRNSIPGSPSSPTSLYLKKLRKQVLEDL